MEYIRGLKLPEGLGLCLTKMKLVDVFSFLNISIDPLRNLIDRTEEISIIQIDIFPLTKVKRV